MTQEKQCLLLSHENFQCTSRCTFEISFTYKHRVVSLRCHARVAALRSVRLRSYTAPVSVLPVSLVIISFIPLCLIDRHHPGDDQRDTSVNGEEDAGRHSGTAETGRGGQPAGLSGSHTGRTLCCLSFFVSS